MFQAIARRIITQADVAGVEAYCVVAGAERQIAETTNATGGLPDLKLGGLQVRYMSTARQLTAESSPAPTLR